MNNRKILLTVPLILALGFACGLVAAPSFVPHKNPSVQWNMEVVKHSFEFDESMVVGEYAGNLITDIGENFIGNATIGLQNNATWAISLSNVGSPLAAWTQLDTEVAANGFTRAAAPETIWVNSGDFALNFTKTFTASGTQQLQTAGLQWDSTASSNNNLFAAATFTQTTFNSGDTLTITWTVTYDAN